VSIADGTFTQLRLVAFQLNIDVAEFGSKLFVFMENVKSNESVFGLLTHDSGKVIL
jgi:hypothetical protein